MTVYYNEFDKFSAAWLRELIKAGVIADGEVDERDMWDVVPSDLVGYDQWHFCAGIGTWSHALRCAGWPDEKKVCTVSLPCQSFSAAGKGGGLDDKRGQLFEAFEWINRVMRFDIILGEQVEAAIKLDWWDVVATSLESEGYSVGAVGFPASSVGAFHLRQRLYWVAESNLRNAGKGKQTSKTRWAKPTIFSNNSTKGLCDYCDRFFSRFKCNSPDECDCPKCQGLCECGSTNFWSNAVWIPCRDGKWRPTQSGLFPLAHGAACRVGRLRGYGNAIVAPAAEAFIRSVMEVI